MKFEIGTSIAAIISSWKLWFKNIDFTKVTIIMCTVHKEIITEYGDEEEK